MSTNEASEMATGFIDVFSQEDWQKLDAIVDTILTDATHILEKPASGDSRNEEVNLDVARFIVRKNNVSKIVNEPFTNQILEIFERANFIGTIEEKAGLANLKILRMQLNSMKEGSHIGPHTDKESDLSYIITTIIRTKSSFTDGKMKMYGDKPEIIEQKNHSVFVMSPDIEHEILPVTSGYRNSIAAFIGYA